MSYDRIMKDLYIEDVRNPIHNRKIGRNEPCWCGSNTKYKKCHLDRDLQPAEHAIALMNQTRKEASSGSCLIPIGPHERCGKKSIDSHTIQRSSSLKAISENGHVISLTPDISLEDPSSDLGRLIGIKKASIFPGFCSEHDSSVFRPIEQNNIDINQETCFLVAYRILLLEQHKKLSSAVLAGRGRSMDKGTPLSWQIASQGFWSRALKGIDAASSNLQDVISMYDNAYMKSDYSEVKYAVFKSKTLLPYVIAGAQWPWYDFNKLDLGNVTEDLERIPNHIVLSVNVYLGCTYVFMIWFGDNPLTQRWVDSFKNIADNERAGRLLGAASRSFENMFFSPAWWKSCDAKEKDYICGMFNELFVEPVECMDICIRSLPNSELNLLSESR